MKKNNCGVCGELKPINEYCPSECWTLDKGKWRENVGPEDVIAGLLGSYSGGRYLPTVVRQIMFVTNQFATPSPRE